MLKDAPGQRTQFTHHGKAATGLDKDAFYRVPQIVFEMKRDERELSLRHREIKGVAEIQHP